MANTRTGGFPGTTPFLFGGPAGLAAIASGLLAISAASSAAAGDMAAASLVSDAEAAASAKAFAAHPEGPMSAEKGLSFTRSSAMAPTIEVLEPHVDAATKPPFDVRVVAHPHEGLAIDHNSIRIRYGFFRIDVTQRMLALGHWQGDTFVVSHANAPTGTHMFYVTLADTAHQEANVAVKVVVK